MPKSKGFAEYEKAFRMRDVVRRMVADELERQRPTRRYAEVTAVDPVAHSVLVVYPNEVDPVELQTGDFVPEIGDTVRVEGPTGDRYVADVRPASVGPPEQVTGLTLTAGVGSLVARWTANEERNVKWNRGFYEVEIDTVDTFDSGDERTIRAAATAAVLTDLTGAVTYFVRVRAVDLAGVEGEWSDTEDEEPLEVIAEGAGIEVVTDLPALPDVDYPEFTVVILDDDGKLYRNVGEVWTAAVEAVDITGEIDTDQIANSAITAAKIGALAVEAGKIAADAVTAVEIAALAVGTSEIAALAVTTAKLDALAVTAAKIAADTITSAEIAANAITSSELAANSVVAGKIAALTIVAADIAAATITGAKIAAATITASNLVADTITAAEIAAGAIGTTELAADSVTSAKIAANTILAADIAADTITAAEIAAGAVATTELAADAVTAAKLAALAIETGKYIRSTTYSAGSSGWSINADGDAEFNDVTIRGAITGSSTNILTTNPGAETAAAGTQQIPNGTFDVDATGWAGNGSCSVARVTTPTKAGAGALAITCNGGAMPTATTPSGTSGFAVVGGTTYDVTAWVRTAATARTWWMSVEFFNSSGAAMDSFPADVVAAGIVDSTTYQQFSGQAFAPPAAAYCRVYFHTNATPPNGEIHYIDEVSFTDSVLGWTNEWTVKTYLNDVSVVSRDTSVKRSGNASAKIVVTGAADGLQALVTEPISVSQNHAYKYSFWVRSGSGIVRVLMYARFYDSKGLQLLHDPARLLINATTTFTNYTYTAKAPADAAYVRFGLKLIDLGTIHIDDATVVTVPAYTGGHVGADYLSSRGEVIDGTGYLTPVGAMLLWAAPFSTTDVYGLGGIGGDGSSDTQIAGCPAGFVPCDGRAVSRTSFWRLFSVIGTTYGVGNGSTTFNVPDMRGKMPIGLNTGWSLNDTTRADINHYHDMSSHTHPVHAVAAGGSTKTATASGTNTTSYMYVLTTAPSRVCNFIIKA